MLVKKDDDEMKKDVVIEKKEKEKEKEKEKNVVTPHERHMQIIDIDIDIDVDITSAPVRCRHGSNFQKSISFF